MAPPPSATSSIRRLAAVNLTALGSLTAPAVTGLPTRIGELVGPDERASALAFVLACGAFAAVVSNPLFGALSDRTRSPWGRRPPWLVGGTVMGAAGITLLTFAPSVGAFAVAWTIAQVGYNATMSSASALLSDTTPDALRARAAGLFTAAAFVGTVPPLLLCAAFPTQVPLVSLLMPLAAFVAVAFAARIRDTAVRPRRARTESGARRLPEGFVAVWAQRFLLQCAFGLATAYTAYLVLDRITTDAAAGTTITALTTVIAGAALVCGATVIGALARRIGHDVALLALAAAGLGVAALIRAFAMNPAMLWTAAAIGGFAIGAHLTVNLALAMRVVPRGGGGTWLGLLNIAEAAPQVFIPLVAAALLRFGGGDPVSGAADDYAAVCVAATLMCVIAIAATPALRRAAAR